MGRLRPGKPSASMVVALVALVMAMGGTSYAAITLGKNSVGSKQLKKNAVTTSKIKNGAVTGKKIKLSSLGTVPSVNGLKRYSKTLATAGPSSSSPTSVSLATDGPFTVLGECYVSGSKTYAHTAVKTSQSGDALNSYGATSIDPFGPSNGAENVTQDYAEATTGSPAFEGPYDGSWATMTPNNSLSVNGFETQAVYQDGPSGPACSFSGYLISEGSSS